MRITGWVPSLFYFYIILTMSSLNWVYLLSKSQIPWPSSNFSNLPMKSCSMKLWNSLAKSKTEEFSVSILVWTSHSCTFWISSRRSPWDVTVTLSPLTQLHSPDTCRFKPSLILSRLSENVSNRAHTPSSLESLRSRPSLERLHSPTTVS